MSNGDFSAFPTQEERTREGELVQNATYGLTKRELFAAMALQGILSNAAILQQHGIQAAPSASNAVEFADALLNALEKPCSAG